VIVTAAVIVIAAGIATREPAWGPDRVYVFVLQFFLPVSVIFCRSLTRFV
jgi:hypothetical protein